MIEANVGRLVCTDKWGVECRSTNLGNRKLIYVVNHNKQAVDLALKSNWKLNHTVELRTGTKQSAGKVHLEPLEMKILEVM